MIDRGHTKWRLHKECHTKLEELRNSSSDTRYSVNYQMFHLLNLYVEKQRIRVIA